MDRSQGEARIMEPAIDLALAFGSWARTTPPRRVEPGAIFDYMDGGGELYLAHGFRHLDVYEYRASDGSSILVEIYALPSSDDAFGLLSGDWTGDPVALTEKAPPTPTPAGSQSRALYGAGLLRLWAGTLYARILASNETPDARQQLIAIGRAIAAKQPTPPPPLLTTTLPKTAPGGYSLQPDQVVFFRSHLVLNSAYYLGSKDLLGLDPRSEAVHAVFQRSRTGAKPARLHLVVVRYADAAAAARGFSVFTAGYLPEHGVRGSIDLAPAAGAVAIEDGWLGYCLKANVLGLVFEAVDRSSAADLAEDAVRRLLPKELSHGQESQ